MWWSDSTNMSFAPCVHPGWCRDISPLVLCSFHAVDAKHAQLLLKQLSQIHASSILPLYSESTEQPLAPPCFSPKHTIA